MRSIRRAARAVDRDAGAMPRPRRDASVNAEPSKALPMVLKLPGGGLKNQRAHWVAARAAGEQ